MIYFDNAATTFKKPKGVYKAVKKAMKDYSANPGRSGHNLSLSASNEVYECRKKVSSFFGGENPENTVFTLNGTMALNMAIKGVLGRGDHAIISSLDHNASARPLEAMRKNGILEYDVAKVFEGDTEKTLESFRRLIKHNTKAIICTHISNVFGTVLPVFEIGKLARDNGIVFILDAAQSAGIIDINAKNLNAGIVCTPAHKALYAPTGTGLMIIDEKIKLKTLMEGGTGSISSSLDQPEFLPDRCESGTLNVPGICGLSAGIDFVRSKGIDEIYKHEESIMQFIYDELKMIPFVTLCSGRPLKDTVSPLVSFNAYDWSSGRTSGVLNEKGIAVRAGLHCSYLAHNSMGTLKRGTVRVSPCVFSTMKEAEAFIDTVKKI